MDRLCSAVLLLLASTLPLTVLGQTTSRPTAQSSPSKPLALPSTRTGASSIPAGPAPKSYPELKVYESCAFPDGLQVVDTADMPSDVHARPVQMHGVTKSVPLLAGRRIVFAYPGSDPYASVKVELLPAENYAANRKLILDDFDDIVSSDKHVAKNASRKPLLNSFFIEGLDRDEIKTNTLGIYLLMDDHARVVTTVYFLNPTKIPLKSPAEYGQKRDTFLYNYTRCIRDNQNGSLFGNSR
jgi:hypothetical protein